MSNLTAEAHQKKMKLVVVGPANCGKTEFIKALVQRSFQSSLRDFKIGWFDVLRVDYSDEKNASGVDIQTHTVVGDVSYEAVYEIMLSNTDGILMMLDMNPLRMEESLAVMIKMADCLKRSGHDVTKVPLVFQYHRAEIATADQVAQWDKILGVHASHTPRFYSDSQFSGASFEGIDTLTRLVYQRKFLATFQVEES